LASLLECLDVGLQHRLLLLQSSILLNRSSNARGVVRLRGMKRANGDVNNSREIL